MLHLTVRAASIFILWVIYDVSAESFQMDGPTNANTDWIAVAMCRTHCFRKVYRWLLQNIRSDVIPILLTIHELYISTGYTLLYDVLV